MYNMRYWILKGWCNSLGKSPSAEWDIIFGFCGFYAILVENDKSSDGDLESNRFSYFKSADQSVEQKQGFSYEPGRLVRQLINDLTHQFRDR